MARLRESYLRQARSPGHGEHWSGPPEMVEWLAALLATHPGQRVLDVGAGIGGPARRLARVAGCHVTAVDLLEPLVRAATKKTQGGCPRARPAFLTASAVALPFRSGSFDQVWSLGVVAHLEDREEMCREVARVLAAGGTAAFTEAFWDGRRAPRFTASAPKPWHPLTSVELSTELLDAGLNHVEVLAWPGRAFSSDAFVSDPNLRNDLLDGRLESRLVLAAAT